LNICNQSGRLAGKNGSHNAKKRVEKIKLLHFYWFKHLQTDHQKQIKNQRTERIRIDHRKLHDNAFKGRKRINFVVLPTRKRAYTQRKRAVNVLLRY